MIQTNLYFITRQIYKTDFYPQDQVWNTDQSLYLETYESRISWL